MIFNRSFRRIKIRSSQRRNTSLYTSRLLKLRLVNWFTTALIFFIAICLLGGIILFIYYSRNLPSPEKVRRIEGFSSIIFDRTGKPIYDIYTDKNRIPVPLSDIPDSLKKATIAIEDKDFFKHQGFDPKGIFRALFHILTLSGFQGGSTLTQQLVKNTLLSSERTLPRKIKEFILSVQLERTYTKDEILQMYLNEAPYGGTMWGIESAAQGYFGKHAKELSFIESVILAGLPQRPSYYSPFASAKAYIIRSEEVLRRMREDGYITQIVELETKKQLSSVKFASISSAFKAPHFVLFIKKQLIDRFGEKMVESGGLRVYTTLDLDLQEKVEKIALEELEKLKDLKVSNGAALVLNPQTGEMLSYLGSKQYDSTDENFQGKFDVVSMGFRQPGSALKPITYAVAFNKGYTASSVLMDVDTNFYGGEGQADYKPRNYDNKFRGPVQLRFALGNSINIPAVKLTALAGVKDILKTASEMGLTTLAPTDENIKRLGLSLVLGGGEVRLLDLVSAYGVFATGGIKNEVHAISKVTTSSGDMLYEYKKPGGKRVLGEDVSFLISHILLDNNARKEVFGENSYLVIPSKTVSVKTGTTDDKKDNWTVGYTSQVAAGVWVGNNDNSPMSAKLASGVTGAAPIWNRIMREALKDIKTEEPKVPENVVSTTIDAFLGGLPKDGQPTRSEYFIRGTEPTAIASFYKNLKLSKSDNKKLANSVEIATGSYEAKEFIVFTEDDPSAPNENRWQQGIDAWIALSNNDNYNYKYPKDTSNNKENTVAVSIKSPPDKSRIDENKAQLRAEAHALRDIKKMELYIDDSLKSTYNSNSIDEQINLDTGVHKIKVKAYDEKGNSGDSEITIGIKTSAEQPQSSPTSAQ